MPGKFEAFKDELEQLGRFTVKLVIHCLLLFVILLFMLLVSWMHEWFRQNYSDLERQEAGTQVDCL